VTAAAPKRAFIVITGDELLRGFVDDANTGFLARELRELGVELAGVRLSSDHPEQIEQALRAVLNSHDLVIVTGGLGPTHDDRTAEVIANVVGLPLTLNEDALASIEQRVKGFAAARGIDPEVFAAGAMKQAMLPRDAEMLNPQGTAPGFVLRATGDRAVVVVLPGPPSELQYSWSQAVKLPEITELGSSASRERVLRTWGLPESQMVTVLEEAEHEDSPACTVTLCAREGELELSIRGNDADRVDELTDSIQRSVGSTIFAVDDERPIASIVGHLLAERDQNLAVAESCTGGMLGMLLTESAGSSAWFHGGVQSYADSVKTDLLGVKAEDLTLDGPGAVSEEVAEQMARGVRERTGADWGLAITGVAGPGGGSAAKPIGTVYLCCAGPATDDHPNGILRTIRLGLYGDRGAIRRRSCISALHLLRRSL
jgi:nicotinamide-nucleotide amidase